MVDQQQDKDVVKRAIPPWFIILVVLLFGFALFGERGVVRVYKAYLQKGELEETISELEQTNAELRREIDALRNDLKAIESIARRELGMVRPDELIYQFHSDEQPPLPDVPTGTSRNLTVPNGKTGQVDTRPDGG